MAQGVIYILTNPSFPEYVKIGYADDLRQRLSQLNRSECIPFAFRVYATYEVDSRLSDKKIHSIIDRINPELRSIENFNGQKRVREFYAMTPEDAYGILEAMAEIHGYGELLKKYEMTESEAQDERLAQEYDNENTERASNFSFSACRISVGEQIEYYENPDIKATVIDDRNVEFEGQSYSLTALAKKLSGKKYAIAGPKFFKYKGEWLNDIRHRLGV